MPRTFNVSIPDANVAVEAPLKRSTHKFEVKCRTAVELQLGFTDVEAMVSFFTIPSGMAYYEQGIQLRDPISVWLVSQTPGVVAEFLVWEEM